MNFWMIEQSKPEIIISLYYLQELNNFTQSCGLQNLVALKFVGIQEDLEYSLTVESF